MDDLNFYVAGPSQKPAPYPAKNIYAPDESPFLFKQAPIYYGAPGFDAVVKDTWKDYQPMDIDEDEFEDNVDYPHFPFGVPMAKTFVEYPVMYKF